MHVLFATAELAPIVKVGGLGEASCGLVRALRDAGHRVDVDMSPEVVEAFRERRRTATAALSRRLAGHGGRLVVTDSSDDLLARVVPSLVAGGVLR